ncbi:DUF461 domain-containing protein [Streptomyces profundus]|uniref:DUF461 domain-containing protein n=1 Tax=Streptomyces profundus TaxID=2867410 RepID=UPI001D166783|nr:DUF461 domain-containing protein [Streptomyces sp. MA3_2.13]UED84803.1 DUF461 domain-containing protein [Streptomyces sp. MA3_2.13]
MSSSLRRGVAAAFFAFPLFALTACGAGHNAETGNVRPDNASAQVEDIKVQSVNIIVPEEGGPVGISASLFNSGTEDQTLEAVGLPGSGTAFELLPAENETRVVVPAGGSVALGGEGNAEAVIADPVAADVRLGNAQHLVFLLSETGEVSLSARVVPATGAFAYYQDWAPRPVEPELPELPELPGVPDENAGTPEDGEDGEEPGDGAAGDTPDNEQRNDEQDAGDGTPPDAGDPENAEDPEDTADGVPAQD